jgi:hypothetical protein
LDSRDIEEFRWDPSELTYRRQHTDASLLRPQSRLCLLQFNRMVKVVSKEVLIPRDGVVHGIVLLKKKKRESRSVVSSYASNRCAVNVYEPTQVYQRGWRLG